VKIKVYLETINSED